MKKKELRAIIKKVELERYILKELVKRLSQRNRNLDAANEKLHKKIIEMNNG